MICHSSEKNQEALHHGLPKVLNIPKQYSELLSMIEPSVIEDEAEYERINSWINSIEQLGDATNAAQVKMLKLLSLLIEKYEDRYIREKWSSPEIILRNLMDERGLQRKDILHIFGGHKSNLSTVLNGKRSISVEQAKKLGDLFQVPFSLFL